MFARVGTERRFSLLYSNNTCTLPNERKKPLAHPSFMQADALGSGSDVMGTPGFITMTKRTGTHSNSAGRGRLYIA
jgi:hypothetical protein